MSIRSALKRSPSSFSGGYPVHVSSPLSSPPLSSPSVGPSTVTSPLSSSLSPQTLTSVLSSGASTPAHSHHCGAVFPAVTQGYEPKVSFDTFENPAATMFSFTLSVKSEGYKRTANTRVYLVASSPDESGQEALHWSLEVLAQDGDEVIVCRGADEESFEKDHDHTREQARELMVEMQMKSAEYDPDRKLSLILEYVPTKNIGATLDRLIALYRPDSVVVGTRGKRSWSNALVNAGPLVGGIGSVSKYVLSHSPVPIIVVRPERRVRKTVEKRRANPKRGRHFEDA